MATQVDFFNVVNSTQASVGTVPVLNFAIDGTWPGGQEWFIIFPTGILNPSSFGGSSAQVSSTLDASVNGIQMINDEFSFIRTAEDVIKITYGGEDYMVAEPLSFAFPQEAWSQMCNISSEVGPVVLQLTPIIGGVLFGEIYSSYIVVADTTAPVITVIPGIDTIDAGSTWTNAGATADGEEIFTYTGEVNTSVAGTYTITYSATDGSNNTGTATRIVIVNAVQSGAICFLGDTKVKTDQGPVAFNKLTTNHFIGGKRIQKILKVRNSDDNMIFIKKYSLGKGIPNKNTYIGRNHGIFLPDGRFARARNLTTNEGIAKHYRNSDLIYNVLLDIHGKMNVNGIICETLNINDPDVRRLLNNSN